MGEGEPSLPPAKTQPPPLVFRPEAKKVAGVSAGLSRLRVQNGALNAVISVAVPTWSIQHRASCPLVASVDSAHS